MRPRIRTIKPEFFASPTINCLGVGARYVAIGLISMADDRGRILAMVPALRTYVFPKGDITERQFQKALDEITGVQFALAYVVDPWSYLWLPSFWRHQKINRPSESTLPPCPDDPFGGLPIQEAMERFKESENGHDSFTSESLNGHGSLTPSRAGVRSDPFLSVVVHLSEQLAGRVRANDPKAHPDPHSDRWVSDMRLLLKDRDGDSEEVERIIDWCQADSFWRSNILSPGKLRKQFTQLVLKAESNVTPIRGNGRPSAGDLLRKINAAEAARGGAA